MIPRFETLTAFEMASHEFRGPGVQMTFIILPAQKGKGEAQITIVDPYMAKRKAASDALQQKAEARAGEVIQQAFTNRAFKTACESASD